MVGLMPCPQAPFTINIVRTSMTDNTMYAILIDLLAMKLQDVVIAIRLTSYFCSLGS